MKLIGIVGGLSWEATALYYRLLNQSAERALGEHHNARSVIVSVDFAEALALANAGEWDGLAALLIGTRFTLESPVYAARLRERSGLTVLTPDAPARDTLQRIIVDELTMGRIEDRSRQECIGIIRALREDGADAIAVACTELPLLVTQDVSPLPLLDTTALHVEAALRMALT